MYGETGVGFRAPAGGGGLSPHVRGNQLHRHRELLQRGSIPACTGKPGRRAAQADGLMVYPRMYGETRPGRCARLRRLGLSPHVRGNRRHEKPGERERRSIPACTGKPLRTYLPPVVGWVYPRMYGETRAAPPAGCRTPGLSPHVRGNPARGGRDGGGIGSIPACTGKPLRPTAGSRMVGVYPRMYGETPKWQDRQRTSRGLSPHVRGNPRDGSHERRFPGSIPACTGKPERCCCDHLPITVYPRMYGETSGSK